MPSTLILSVMGPDRPGLVDALSRTLAEHGANWVESRMTCLGNQFAGMLLITVPFEKVVALEHDLGDLRSQGLRVNIDTVGKPAPEAPPARTIRLELMGQDRPGIVRDVAGALVEAGVSIEELETRCENAPWSSDRIFRARAVLSAPVALDVDALMARFDAIANAQLVEITLHEVTSARPRGR